MIWSSHLYSRISVVEVAYLLFSKIQYVTSLFEWLFLGNCFAGDIIFSRIRLVLLFSKTWYKNTLHWLTAWKRYYFNVIIASVRSVRDEIVTQIYMKLWLTSFFFLYHSGSVYICMNIYVCIYILYIYYIYTCIHAHIYNT